LNGHLAMDEQWQSVNEKTEVAAEYLLLWLFVMCDALLC
jgi:hypothetical protein